MAKKSSSESADNVSDFTASEVLQRRMGLGKLIADRLAARLSEEDQKAFVASHVEQDFDAYSRFVAQLQFSREEVAASTDAGTAGTDTSVASTGTDKSEAEVIRDYLTENPNTENKDVIAALAANGVDVSSSQVSAAKRQLSESD